MRANCNWKREQTVTPTVGHLATIVTRLPVESEREIVGERIRGVKLCACPIKKSPCDLGIEKKSRTRGVCPGSRGSRSKVICDRFCKEFRVCAMYRHFADRTPQSLEVESDPPFRRNHKSVLKVVVVCSESHFLLRKTNLWETEQCTALRRTATCDSAGAISCVVLTWELC